MQNSGNSDMEITTSSLQRDLGRYKNNDRILLAVDCIIFGFDGKQMKALLIKRAVEPEKGTWSLMGGFVKKSESVDSAAERILHKLTGLRNIYMEQLHCFGEVDRDTADRVVSIAYFALINIANYYDQLLEDYEAQWYSLDQIPTLVFDHKQMMQKAKGQLQQKVANHPIGFELLPTRFTLPQLQSLYEAIYEVPLDKRNFTRKILALNVLKKLSEKEKESSRKGAFYYVFDKENYNKLQHDGINFL